MSKKTITTVVATLCAGLFPFAYTFAGSGLAYNMFGTPIGAILSNFGIFLQQTLVPLLFSIGFLLFVWGVFRFFILGSDQPEEREKARTLMVYSLIGFLLLTVLWGLFNFVSDSLGINVGVTSGQFPTDSSFPDGVSPP